MIETFLKTKGRMLVSMKYLIKLTFICFLVISVASCNKDSDLNKKEIIVLKNEIAELKSKQLEHKHEDKVIVPSDYNVSLETEREYLSRERLVRICSRAYHFYLKQKLGGTILEPKYQVFIKDVIGTYNADTDKILCGLVYDLEKYQRRSSSYEKEVKKYYHVGRSDDELTLPIEHVTHELFLHELKQIKDSNETKL